MKEIVFEKIFQIQSQGILPLQEDYFIFNEKRNFFVLADGFGGEGVGSEISKIACESIQHFLDKEAGDEEATLPFHLRSYFSIAANVLFNAVLYANKKVLEFNKDKKKSKQGGCSLIAGTYHNGTLALASVGLCRVQLKRNTQFQNLNHPKSWMRFKDPLVSLVDPLCDVPLMALGLADSLEPEITELKLQNLDEIYIASDGVTSAEMEIKTVQNQPFRDNASFLALGFKSGAKVLKDSSDKVY